MFKIFFAAMLLILTTSHAFAQSRNCAPREAILEMLSSNFSESRQTMGLSGQGESTVVIEMYANLESGTWTAVMTRGDGISCVVASGQAFELTPQDELVPSGMRL